jgi:hypothetical protein
MRSRGGRMRKILVLMVASMSMAAFAQQNKKPEQRMPPTQEMIFDGDLIEGGLSRPDVEYFDAQSHVFHKSLIKVREEFKDKVLNSAGEL